MRISVLTLTLSQRVVFSIVKHLLPYCNRYIFFLAVNGGYSEWTEWTPCDKTCGDGIQERERGCINPSPSNRGKDCSDLGPASETKKCKIAECGKNLFFCLIKNEGCMLVGLL